MLRSGDREGLLACHHDSFFHAVASPFHSFVTAVRSHDCTEQQQLQLLKPTQLTPGMLIHTRKLFTLVYIYHFFYI